MLYASKKLCFLHNNETVELLPGYPQDVLCIQIVTMSFLGHTGEVPLAAASLAMVACNTLGSLFIMGLCGATMTLASQVCITALTEYHSHDRSMLVWCMEKVCTMACDVWQPSQIVPW